ncbi:Glutathione transferase omega-1 [Rhodotorula toruloides ATCC 204091]|uniref:Glutathione transferase omega-1 n=2 Tax=Rhodotorula toruloides TaxID=5286 RepID=A0A2T0AG77_RHOTO|nr:Glutathione transferase omega-1 [Rhodotorula toruloides ATCC 204091]PRQ77006.1 glutathione transferase omega-1 [Rhodotorula toruloides]
MRLEGDLNGLFRSQPGTSGPAGLEGRECARTIRAPVTAPAETTATATETTAEGVALLDVAKLMKSDEGRERTGATEGRSESAAGVGAGAGRGIGTAGGTSGTAHGQGRGRGTGGEGTTGGLRGAGVETERRFAGSGTQAEAAWLAEQGRQGRAKEAEGGEEGAAGQDIYTKSDEFHAWLIGEKMLNPETLSKAKEKEIFKQFMEDYNTGTLPNEKYYDIKQYEQRMTAVRMGETVDKSDSYDFMKDLEAAKSSQRRSAAASSEQLMDRSRLEELRKLQTDRVQKEKMQRLGMDVSENLGVRLEDKLR